MQIDPTKKWTHDFPVWTGRPDSSGFIATFTLPLWEFLLLACLVTLNVAVWSVIGLVEAVQYVIG